MVELLKTLIPAFSHFEERPVLSSTGAKVGFESVLITKDGYPFSGGTAADLNQARRICAAEGIERAYFKKLHREAHRENDPFLLLPHPTTCGFAAGFDDESTLFRAVCEAVERWAWSKWVDSGIRVPRAFPKAEGELKTAFRAAFDEVFYFQVPIKLNAHLRPNVIPETLLFSAVIGVSGSGVFPGSRVTTAKDDSWEHPLLEAWRHKQIFTNELSKSSPRGLFDQRIKAFGEDGRSALDQLLNLTDTTWPEARLSLAKKASHSDHYHVWRVLCDDYTGWEKGDATRFIY